MDTENTSKTSNPRWLDICWLLSLIWFVLFFFTWAAQRDSMTGVSSQLWAVYFLFGWLWTLPALDYLSWLQGFLRLDKQAIQDDYGLNDQFKWGVISYLY